MAEYGIYIAAAMLALSIIGGLIKIMRAIRDLEAEIRSDMAAQIENITHDVAQIGRDTAARAETLRHDTGEMGSALRAKIHEIETWNRDTFVRKESFEMVISRLEKSIEKLGDKIEDKMERIVERIQARPD